MARTKVISDQAVVSATGRVLLRVGPHAFTLADVAAETGLSPATLLQRFGSKRGLLLAFARASAADAAAPFVAARAEHRSPLAALRAGLISAQHGLGSRTQVANSLGVLLLDLSDEELRAHAARHARSTERAIRSLLDEAVAAAELAPTPTAELALSIQAAWNGAVIQWALRGSGGFEPFLKRVLEPLLPTASKRRSLPA